MRDFRRLLERTAAALVGAAAVGIVAAIVMTVVGLATCDARCVSAAGSNYTFGVVGELIFGFIWSPVFAVVLGTLPGLVALTMTPAANHPWRSLPVLVAATSVGFALWLILRTRLNIDYGLEYLLTLFLIPSITGLVAAWNINRLPPLFRLDTAAHSE